uniref:Uncharacterized protein n=1 Tax=Anguilla anguilla TaxID=7936 RepID=A0A0E9TTD6_ANGAN
MRKTAKGVNDLKS